MAGRSTGSGEAAAALIRRMIFDGVLRTGDRVPQDEVAARLGVSRIPVREALIALEREGWVTIEIHRGAFINALDETAVRDHYALYALVYGWAGHRALQRGDGGVVPRLRALDADLAAARPAEIGRLTVAFNAAVVEASGSSRARVVLRSMTGLLAGDLFDLVPDAVDVVRPGCRSVLHAMAAGDEDGVTEAYAAMMEGLGEAVVAMFRDRGLLDGERTGAALATKE